MGAICRLVRDRARHLHPRASQRPAALVCRRIRSDPSRLGMGLIRHRQVVRPKTPSQRPITWATPSVPRLDAGQIALLPIERRDPGAEGPVASLKWKKQRPPTSSPLQQSCRSVIRVRALSVATDKIYDSRQIAFLTLSFGHICRSSFSGADFSTITGCQSGSDSQRPRHLPNSSCSL